MTKGELRKARKQAVAEGRPLTGELALPGMERARTARQESQHYARMERWARRSYDNHRPDESDYGYSD